MEKEKYKHNNLTQKIIGLAFELFNEIGTGYPEKVYQKGLATKLEENHVKYIRESYCKLTSSGKIIGQFRVDFVVEGKVVVELKARRMILNRDIAQTLTYLKMKNLEVGLILLFGLKKVEIKRLAL